MPWSQPAKRRWLTANVRENKKMKPKINADVIRGLLIGLVLPRLYEAGSGLHLAFQSFQPIQFLSAAYLILFLFIGYALLWKPIQYVRILFILFTLCLLITLIPVVRYFFITYPNQQYIVASPRYLVSLAISIVSFGLAFALLKGYRETKEPEPSG